MTAELPARQGGPRAVVERLTAGLLRVLPQILLRGLLAGLRQCPRSWFGPLGHFLAVLLRGVARKDLERLRQNVHAVYGLPPGTHFARSFERQVLRHQVTCALETLRAIQEPGLLTVEGLAELAAQVGEAEAKGRGHIIVTAHLGSWELCAYFGQKAASRTFHVLAKPSRSKAFTEFLDALRRRMGTPVLWTDRRSLVRDMLGALKRGESVGFVMDQKPEGRRGPVVEFFGLPTEFVSGPATMAIRTGCAVIAVFCLREGPFRYRLVSRTLAPAGHGEQDELALTQRMATEIESVIRAYPEQWTWTYKRWRFARPLVPGQKPRLEASAG